MLSAGHQHEMMLSAGHQHEMMLSAGHQHEMMLSAGHQHEKKDNEGRPLMEVLSRVLLHRPRQGKHHQHGPGCQD
jgi:hypothetical protein